MENNQTRLNPEVCENVAKTIRDLKLRPDFYSREYLNLAVDEETKFRMHFFAVAICHQTYSLQNQQLNLYGWDFLEYGFVKFAKSNSVILDPDFLAHSSAKEVIEILRPVFSPDENPENCTLDRLDERAELMIQAGKLIYSDYQNSVKNLIGSAAGFLLNEGKGLYEILPRFEAFTDPLQKKSTFLIKLLMEAGLLKINDPDNFIPIMDYHMQRVLMRLGCIEIIDKELHEKLLNRETLPSDEVVRNRCIEAFRLIAEISGHPVTKMNDFFWSLGRSCCNQTTLCQNKVCEKIPCTFTQIIEINDHSHCIFEPVCKGFRQSDYRNLWQPVIETHYY
jgi:hypothetical protein